MVIADNRLKHIFRVAEGHFSEDTPANRQLLLDLVADQNHYLITDVYGNAWYAETRADGTQLWAQVRNEQIVNGGINQPPKQVNSATGLNVPSHKG